MPLAGIFLVFNLNTYISVVISPEAKNIIYLIVAINTFFVPGFIAIYMYKKKMISSLAMGLREERWFSFIMTGLFFYFTYYLIKQLLLPQIVYSVVLGAFFSICIITILNLKWKISIHMCGISGLAGAVFAISQKLMVDVMPVLVSLLLIAGIIGFARLKLKAHRPAEIYTGVLIGFLCEYAAVIFDMG